jgi:hypothetical protein
LVDAERDEDEDDWRRLGDNQAEATPQVEVESGPQALPKL